MRGSKGSGGVIHEIERTFCTQVDAFDVKGIKAMHEKIAEQGAEPTEEPCQISNFLHSVYSFFDKGPS